MKTLTKKTHIAKVRQANRKGIEQVCHLLQWSEQQYCDYLFDQYCQFIEEKYKGFPAIISNNVLYSDLFRGMFNNAAAQRDKLEFTPYALDVTEEVTVINPKGILEIVQTIPLGGQYLVDEWMHIHNYKRLLTDKLFLNQFEHILKLIQIL